MSKDLDQIIGSNIRHLREAKKMTMSEMGSLCSDMISMQQIHKYEKGITSITAVRLYELSIILNCPLIAFYEGIKDYKQDLSALLENIHNKAIHMALINLIEVMEVAKHAKS